MPVARRHIRMNGLADRLLRSKQQGYGAVPLRPAFLEGCLARKSMKCRACADVCEKRAMSFAIRADGLALPQVLFDRCSGCGICADICPASAITMHLPDQAAAI